MAYFHCLIGGGSSGSGLTVVVTCDPDLAGTTITCTDGVTTLTATCPSASPYEVEFDIPNGGDWTISGVMGGETVSTEISFPTTVMLTSYVQKTITIHSAKEDTISYTDVYGDTQTEVFASGQTSKQITVTIDPNGSSLTFVSGVAKDPSNLSNAYSKTVTITNNTSDVWLMPNNVLYWWGYESSDLENLSTANGWNVGIGGFSFGTPTHNTNYIDCNANTSGVVLGVGSKTTHSGNFNVIVQGITSQDAYGGFQSAASKSWYNFSTQEILYSSSLTIMTLASQSSKYLDWATNYGSSQRQSHLFAMWYE